MSPRSLTDALGDIGIAEWPAWARTLVEFTAERLESDHTPDVTVLTLPTNEGVASAIASAIAAADLRCAATVDGSDQEPPPLGVPVSYLSGKALHDADEARLDGGILRVGHGTGFVRWWGTITSIPSDVAGRPPYKKLSETVERLVDGLEMDRRLLQLERSVSVQSWMRRFVCTAARPIVLCGTPGARTELARLGTVAPQVGPIGVGHQSHGRTLIYTASATKTIPQARLTILDGHIAALAHWPHCPRPVLILLDRRRTQAAEAANELEMHGFVTAGEPRLRELGVEEMHLYVNLRSNSASCEDDGDDPL